MLDFSAFITTATNTFFWIVPFLFLITILVFFHELGHYFSARRHGVRVEAFAVGFGKELFGFTDKHGTRWKLCAIPFGGYVQMFSDLNPASQPDQKKIQQMSEADKAVSLFHKTPWQRIEVAAAGPVANYILAFFIFVFAFMVDGERMPVSAPIVGAIAKNSPAEKAGFQIKDEILWVSEAKDGKAIGEKRDKLFLFEILSKTINELETEQVAMGVQRGQEGEKVLFVTPGRLSYEDPKTGEVKERRLIGILPEIIKVKRGFLDAVGGSILKICQVTVMTFDVIWQAVTGSVEARSQFSGPLGIMKASKDMAEKSLWDLAYLGALLSLALGIFNLLPIPVLDGGHILLCLVEIVIGKPVSPSLQEWFMRIGFGFVMILFTYVMWNDITRLFFS